GVLREELSEGSDSEIALVAEFGIRSLTSQLDYLLRRWHRIASAPWLALSAEELFDLWQRHHAEQILPTAAARVRESPAARDILRLLQQADISHPKWIERKAVLEEALPNLQADDQLAESLRAIHEAAKVVGVQRKAFGDDLFYETYKADAKTLRETIKEIEKLVPFDRSSLGRSADLGCQLLRLAASLHEAYAGRKRDLGALDFDDLLIHARRLLGDPARHAMLEQIQSRIGLLMVDEFQDTSPLQVELVRALCGDQLAGGRLFFVGDFKQSIYRFRGADPRVFRELEQEIPPVGRLPLSLNFRSQPAVLQFVNTLFQDVFAPQYQPLRAHRQQLGPTPAIEMLWATVDTQDDAEGKVPVDQLRRCEADWIARRLRQMIDDGERVVEEEPTGEGTSPRTRGVRPGDVAILFRALSNVQYYEEALRRYDVDYYLVGGHAFYSQQEIFDLIHVLSAIASPCDQVNLAGALRSPFFALTDETLFWLARHDNGLAGGLFAPQVPASVPDEQRPRVRFAAQTLTTLRRLKDRIPIARLIHKLLETTGYDAVLLAEFMGERKLANLQKLIDMARTFDRAGSFELSDLVVQLSQFVASQPKEALAATTPETENVVRLMTIHQAKGLEFPVTVIPDLARASHSQSPPVVLSSELGPLLAPAGDPANPARTWQLDRESEESDRESDRLFYVACTRAADYLILASGVNDLDKPAGKWMRMLADRYDLRTGHPIGGEGTPSGGSPLSVRLERPPVRGRTDRKRATDWWQTAQRAVDLDRHGARPTNALAEPLDARRWPRRRFSFSRISERLPSDVAAIDPDQLLQRPRHESPTISGPSHPAREVTSPQVTPPDTPAPDTLTGLDPQRFGSLAHAVLEQIGFDRLPSVGEIERLARRLVPRYFSEPSARQAVAEATQLTTRFLASTRASQLLGAKRCYRELDFDLAWPLGDLSLDHKTLEGVIDCLYQDDGEKWHVLDYKTNHVPPGGLNAVARPYVRQLHVYALAVERVLGEGPAELTLYFLRPGLEVSCAWDASVRERTVAELESVIG
ncbi:MAG: UvrD-helicase domain-containing protein, partial [Pirellulales bacterium]